MNMPKGQLTMRGLAIGLAGCAVITASSVYIALKMGALPWPIVLAAILSMLFLKALGDTSLNEANVTHTVMSAGAMVGGGLAFTIPAIWILGFGDAVAWWQMLLVALCGTVLGLLFTALLRRHFIEDEQLEYPMGQAAAVTLMTGGGSTRDDDLCEADNAAESSESKMGVKLFASMGFAGLYALLRDGLGVLPSLVGVTGPAGVFFGVFNSPMMLAVGFMVGVPAILAWFAGGVVGDGLIVIGGSAAGLWDAATASGVKSSLGMGLMMGCGLAIVAKDVLLPLARSAKRCKAGKPGAIESAPEVNDRARAYRSTMNVSSGLIALALAAVGLIACFALQLGPLPALIVVAFAWVTCAMAAQSVGQSGIDPMEVFGLIVLLIVAVFADVPQVQLLFVAGIIAVACGLAGDVMNDFKAGHMLGTDPRAQWIGQAIGSLIGAVVAVAVMSLLLAAYGAESFGVSELFISAQANVVATMISGIPSIPAFVFGLVIGAALYAMGLPGMMFGLGVYLPLYYGLTVALGMVARLLWTVWCKRSAAGLSEADEASLMSRREQDGLVLASGLLGGESIVGVVFALLIVMAAVLA